MKKPMAMPKIKTPTMKTIAKPAKPKVAAPPVATGPQYYDEKGKPDPNGLYDKDQFMVRVPGKASKFTKQPQKQQQTPEQIAAAKRAGYAK